MPQPNILYKVLFFTAHVTCVVKMFRTTLIFLTVALAVQAKRRIGPLPIDVA
jgi:hypothetical protein